MMILSLCATHEKASVPMLESLTFSDGRQALEKLLGLPIVEECVLVQTCNRVEIHVVTSNVSSWKAIEGLVGFWSQNVNISRDIIFRVLQVFEGIEAGRHLLSLTAGLESMVVGEDQILGQIRDAYVEAKEVGAAKAFLGRMFMKAVNVGRRVRSETGINQGSLSISSVAVDLAEKLLGDLKSKKVLLVGAGEAATLAAKELFSRSARGVLVANRTFQRGVQLAEMIEGKAVRLEELYNHISGVDLVIVATSAPSPLMTLKDLKSAPSYGGSSGLLVMDISQPRCVEEEVTTLPGVYLKTIDDLRPIVEENIKRRSGEADRARKIVLEELDHLEKLLKRMKAEPTISVLTRSMESIRRRELSKAIRMLGSVDEDQRRVVEDLTRELTERILQSPIESLREAALNDDHTLFTALRKLFNLKDEN